MISFARASLNTSEFKYKTNSKVNHNKKSMSFSKLMIQKRPSMVTQSTTPESKEEAVVVEATKEPQFTQPPALTHSLSIGSNCSDITTTHTYNHQDNSHREQLINANYCNDDEDDVASDFEMDVDDDTESEISIDEITRMLGEAELEDDVLENMYEEEERYHSLSWYSEKMNARSAQSKIRKHAIQWLRSTCAHYGFESTTEFRSMHYFDRLCSIKHLRPNRYGLVAATCLFIAAKYNETWEKVPCLDRYAHKCGYGAHAIAASEAQILRALDWKLKVTVSIDFVQYFIHQKTESVLFENDLIFDKEISHYGKMDQVKEDMEKFAVFFLRIASQNYSFWQYSSSTVAAAAIYAARRSMEIKPYNHSKVGDIYQCDDDEIKRCFEQLWAVYHRKFSKQAAIYESNQPQSLN